VLDAAIELGRFRIQTARHDATQLKGRVTSTGSFAMKAMNHGRKKPRRE
jgi:hypothetical protein